MASHRKLVPLDSASYPDAVDAAEAIAAATPSTEELFGKTCGRLIPDR